MSKEPKRYRLLKDLPGVKASAIFTEDYGDDTYGYNSDNGEDCRIRRWNVEMFPQWFEEIKEQKDWEIVAGGEADFEIFLEDSPEKRIKAKVTGTITTVFHIAKTAVLGFFNPFTKHTEFRTLPFDMLSKPQPYGYRSHEYKSEQPKETYDGASGRRFGERYMDESPYPFHKQPKERIVVTNFWFECHSGKGYGEYSFEVSEIIPEEKRGAVKAAIESVLNDESYADKYMRMLKEKYADGNIEAILFPPDKKYTQSDLEKSFEAARMKKYYTPDGEDQPKIVNQFPTFQSYLSSKQQG